MISLDHALLKSREVEMSSSVDSEEPGTGLFDEIFKELLPGVPVRNVGTCVCDRFRDAIVSWT